MKKQSLVVRAAVVAACVFAVSGASLAQADHNNKLNKVMKGTWALSVSGWTNDTSPLAPAGTPLFAVATVTFDGKGGCSSIDQIVLGGQFIPSRDGFRTTTPDGACTYQVNADGTGSFDVTFPGGGPTNVTFVLTDRSDLDFIASNTSLGIYGGGKMSRQSSSRD